jgi:hypothetical protein
MADALVERSRIQEIVAHRSESLNVEFKRWIDPRTPAGAAKVVKATLALRNRNGGSLVIGFDDKTLDPVYDDMPSDVHDAFHVDTIQGLVSRYASEIFEVRVDFVNLNGREHPVISVPSGVRTTVAAKADLVDGTKKLIRVHDVYFRNLTSNGTPSTSIATYRDWSDIIQICLDNREADIGRFLRRQLSGTDISTLAAALGQVGSGPEPPPSLQDETVDLLERGENKLDQAISARSLSALEREVLSRGSWSVGLVVNPPVEDAIPDQSFQSKVASSNPRYTGWPVWLDTSDFRDPQAHPHVTQGGVEALVVSLGDDSTAHVDFLWFDPRGEFYLWRVLQDDLTRKRKALAVLEPVLVILRVAEAIAVGLSLAKALGRDPEKTVLGFAFKWTKLKGRELDTWANPMVGTVLGRIAHDDEVTTFVEVPLDTPASAIAPYVERAVRDLFVLFGGFIPGSDTIEYWVKRLIERQLP